MPVNGIIVVKVRWTKCERENIFKKIHHRILGGENNFKYIFSPKIRW